MNTYITEKGGPQLDVFSTYFPLYSILHILGLSSVYRSKGKLKISPLFWKFSLIFCILILATSGNVICYYMKICIGPSGETFNIIVKMFHLVGNFQYVIDVYFVHKYGKQSFIDYLSVYQYIDKSLGRTNYEQIKRSIKRVFLFVALFSILVYVFNVTSFFICLGGIFPALNVLVYVFYFLKVFNTLDMISNAIQVKYRLKIIADVLKEYFYHTDYISGVYHKAAHKVSVNKESQLDSYKYGSVNYNTIMGLSRCYLLLFKQCHYINIKYGFRILLHNLLFVIDIVMILHFIIRLIFGLLVIQYSWLPIIATAAGLVLFCTVFYCGVHSCEQSYRQTERITFWSENLLINKKLSPEVQDALRGLINLVQFKPISFHVLHFYKIKYSGIMTIASAVVTYTIIFLQDVT